MLAGGVRWVCEALSLQIWSAKYVNRIYASCARQLVDQAKNRQDVERTDIAVLTAVLASCCCAIAAVLANMSLEIWSEKYVNRIYASCASSCAGSCAS
jgi:hypothetical protein